MSSTTRTVDARSVETAVLSSTRSAPLGRLLGFVVTTCLLRGRAVSGALTAMIACENSASLQARARSFRGRNEISAHFEPRGPGGRDSASWKAASSVVWDSGPLRSQCRQACFLFRGASGLCGLRHLLEKLRDLGRVRAARDVLLDELLRIGKAGGANVGRERRRI